MQYGSPQNLISEQRPNRPMSTITRSSLSYPEGSQADNTDPSLPTSSHLDHLVQQITERVMEQMSVHGGGAGPTIRREPNLQDMPATSEEAPPQYNLEADNAADSRTGELPHAQ